MKVRILSPEKTLFEGNAKSIQLPGGLGNFEVLDGHAPLISTLGTGKVVCKGDTLYEVEVNGGFVEVAMNEVSVCVEQ